MSQAERAAAAAETTKTALAQRKLGVPSLVFIMIAASSPLTVLAGGATTSFAVTEELGVPVGYLILGVMLALFAVGYGRMSTVVQNAGAFFAYVSAGLGPRFGVSASFLALLVYNSMQIGLYGVFGFTAASFLDAKLGIPAPWWLCALVAWAIIAALGINAVDVSAKVLGVVVTLEFLVVIGISVLSLGIAPEGISADPFLPMHWLTGSLGAILAFGIAACMGFEQGAIYSEETKCPEKSVARATYIAVALISGFYALAAWALAMGVGPSRIIGQSQELGPDLMFVLLGENTSVLVADIGTALFLGALLACMLAFHNASARYFFSMGRAGLLPTALSRSRANGAPAAGSIAQSLLGAVFILVFAVAGAGSAYGVLYPVLTMFPWLTNTSGLGMVLLLTLTGMAIIGFFRKNPMNVSAWVSVVAPAISTAGLAIIALLIMFNFDVMIESDGFSPLVVILPGSMVVVAVFGYLYAIYLQHRRPDVYRRISTAEIR